MEHEGTINEVLEIVQFLKDNAASKQDLANVATKQDLAQTQLYLEVRIDKKSAEVEVQLVQSKSEILTHVDSFIALHQKLEQELVALRGKYERLEEIVEKIAVHLRLDMRTL